MRKWTDVKIVLHNGKEISLTDSYFKMRGESMFCIENDQGEGNCIPVDNISTICLKGKSLNKEQQPSNNKESLEEKEKKTGFLSIFKK